MKDFIKIFLLSCLLVTQASKVFCQVDELDRLLNKLTDVNNDVFYSEDFYNKSVVYSISIGVNRRGVVDTILFSNKKNELLNRLVDFKKIKKELLGNKTAFKSYKNEFLIVLVSMVRGDENYIRITNGNEYVNDWFAISITAFELGKMGRKQIFLPPVVIEHKGRRIIN